MVDLVPLGTAAKVSGLPLKQVVEKLKLAAAALFVLTSTFAITPTQPISVQLPLLPWKTIIVSDIAFVLLVAVWLLATAVQGQAAWPHRVWPAAFVPVAAIVVSAALCAEPGTGIPNIARVAYSSIAYVLLAQLVFTEARIQAAVRLYLVASIAIAIIALAAYWLDALFGLRSALVFTQDVPGAQLTIDRRTMGPFSHPGILAIFLNTAMFSACTLWLLSTERIDRVLALTGGMLFTIALVLTSARAFGGVFLGLFLVSLLMPNDRPWKVVRTVALGEIVLGVTAIVAVFVTWDILPYRLTKDDQTQFGTLSVYMAPEPRRVIWSAGLRMFADHPVFGIGPGLFEPNFSKYVSLSDLAVSARYSVPDPADLRAWWEKSDPHSTFIGWLARLGVVGFSALCWFFGRQAVQLYRRHNEPGLYGKLAVVGFAFLMGLFYGGLTQEILHLRFFWSYLAFLTAIFATRSMAACPAGAEPPELAANLEREGGG